MTLTTDPNFIEKLRANNSEAWALAYDRLYNKAIAKVKFGLYSTGDHDVENLAADILSGFVRALLEKKNEKINSAKTFDDLVNMIAYIANLRTIDYLRKLGARPKETGVDPEVLEAVAKSRESSMSGFSFKGIPFEEIVDCLEKLPEKLKQIWKLTFEGLSLRQIAEQLGINYNTACGLRAEGRSGIIDCLKSKGYNP